MRRMMVLCGFPLRPFRSEYDKIEEDKRTIIWDDFDTILLPDSDAATHQCVSFVFKCLIETDSRVCCAEIDANSALVDVLHR